MDPATGDVSTLLGGGVCGIADGPAATAELCGPVTLAFEGADQYVAAPLEARIRRFSGGSLTTVAGTPWWWSFADGPALQASFDEPGGMFTAPGGGLLLADTANNRIRRIVP